MLVRYDTTAANVVVRRSEDGFAEPLYPRRLDLLLTPHGEFVAGGDGSRYQKDGETLRFDGATPGPARPIGLARRPLRRLRDDRRGDGYGNRGAAVGAASV